MDIALSCDISFVEIKQEIAKISRLKGANPKFKILINKCFFFVTGV